MKTIRVDVTAKNIRRGDPSDCTNCPVALALNRATGLDWHADKYDLIAGTDRDPIRVRTPGVVAMFMTIFDDPKSRGQAKPFSFAVM